MCIHALVVLFFSPVFYASRKQLGLFIKHAFSCAFLVVRVQKPNQRVIAQLHSCKLYIIQPTPKWRTMHVP